MTIKENKNNLDLVKEMVQLIKENDLSEIELERSDKDSDSVYIRISRIIDSSTSQVSASQSGSTALPILRENIVNDKKPTENSNVENNPGALLSPMVGTVYLASEPDASPFVQVGDRVVTGQTILIVEAMKTLNQIPAIKGGIIKRILVEDGTPVEYGSPLVVIE